MKTPALLGQMTMTLNHSGNIDSPPLATRLGGCWRGRGRLTWGGAGGVAKVTFPFVFLLFVVIIFVLIFLCNYFNCLLHLLSCLRSAHSTG